MIRWIFDISFDLSPLQKYGSPAISIAIAMSFRWLLPCLALGSAAASPPSLVVAFQGRADAEASAYDELLAALQREGEERKVEIFYPKKGTFQEMEPEASTHDPLFLLLSLLLYLFIIFIVFDIFLIFNIYFYIYIYYNNYYWTAFGIPPALSPLAYGPKAGLCKAGWCKRLVWWWGWGWGWWWLGGGGGG